MKRIICLWIVICLLTALVFVGGCTAETMAEPISVVNGMTDTEISQVTAEKTELGESISLYDEEIGETYEITLLKSTAYDPSKTASFYLVQGTEFNETQIRALRDYLAANAPQTLLAILGTGKDKKSKAAAKRDFVDNAKAYEDFIADNLLGWVCETYAIDRIGFAGYGDAGYFAAYMLYGRNAASNYLIVNPEMKKTTDKTDIIAREDAFHTGGHTSLKANVCVLRSEDDQSTFAFKAADTWLNALSERKYDGLTISNDVLAGSGHNVIDCEAMLRGLCYFSGKEYGESEEACVAASKAMTQAEKDSITVGKLSKDHEFYNEVVGIDPECADYINEISIYDQETDDTFVVHISLPPNYDESKTYPLVLMTDGVWRLSDHPELRPLMVSGQVEDVILVSVGYPNGYDYIKIRERDLLQQPDIYLQFLVENLMPYLCETYRVDTGRVTLTGHSYGGYWSVYALFHSDTIGKNTFANYYIGSPSYQANTNRALATDFDNWYFERNKTLNCRVYVTVGGKEEAGFIGLIERGVNGIVEHGYEGLQLDYEVIDGYDHNTVFKPSIKNTLIKFYGKQ